MVIGIILQGWDVDTALRHTPRLAAHLALADKHIVGISPYLPISPHISPYLPAPRSRGQAHRRLALRAWRAVEFGVCRGRASFFSC